MSKINGTWRPAVMPARFDDFTKMAGQYIRHNDSGEIYKIAEVGRDGVTAYRAEGFGGPAGGQEFLITWASLRHKHTFMVHVADIETKPGETI